MKPCDEGEMEGRRRRSINSNRITNAAGSRRSITGTRTPHNDVDIDRYRTWRHQQTQAATQQRNAANNILIPRSTQAAATTALDSTGTNVSSSLPGKNQKEVVPKDTGSDNNPTQEDDDTYATFTSQEQEQARWNDMVFPDTSRRSAMSASTSSPAARSAIASPPLGYYYKEKKHNKVEEAKEEEQAIWDGMVHPHTAVLSTTLTDTSCGNPSSINKKKKNRANGPNQELEPAQERQQNDPADNVAMAAGGATSAFPHPAAPTAGAFAVHGDEMMQRGGEADTFQERERAQEIQQNDSTDNVVMAAGSATTASSPPAASTAGAVAVRGDRMAQQRGEADTFSQVSEVGTAVLHAEDNSVLAPNQNNENVSPVLVQAHLVAHDSQEQRIQQLETLAQRQQQQLQQPTALLVHAEVAIAAPVDVPVNNTDEMPSPSLPVDEQEQLTERSDKGAIRGWIMKNRRNHCIALGLVAVAVVAVVVAVTIPLSKPSSGSSSSSNRGVASNNSTGPPSTSPPPLGEASSAPTTADTKTPVTTSPPSLITTTNPTEAPTRLPTSAPTSPPPTQLPSLDPTITMSPTRRPWKPLGQELGGKAEQDYFGRSVSLSRDARVLAVGAIQIGAVSRPGYVSVFESDDDSNGSWMAKGQELVGEANGDNFGWSVALNGDGTILAVGAIDNDGGGFDAGHVRVFQHDTSTNLWVQLGSDIDGEADNDWFGVSVSLSKTGDILAVGAYGSDYGSIRAVGSVRTFQYDRVTDSWEQIGQTLFGKEPIDAFGYSVSLSSSGAIVAVGATHSDSGGNNAGQVSMHQYNSVSSEWNPMGSPINGQVEYGEFGSLVFLDDSGMVVAVSALWEDDVVFVYTYDNVTMEWTQRGQTLKSQQPGNLFGESVSLSGNGNVLAVGSVLHDAIGLENLGQVTIFQYNANTMEWDAVGESVNGKAAGDWFGGSVSLSDNGTVVAVGSYRRDFNGMTWAGSASVYTLN